MIEECCDCIDVVNYYLVSQNLMMISAKTIPRFC